MTDSSDDSTGEADAHSDDTDASGGLSKRTLIRLLVGFGIGIPLLVEGLTFLGLLGQQFGDGDGGDAGGDTTTTTRSGVTVGDDLLPETERSETLASAVLREVEGDRWPLSLTVEVQNSGDTDYEFQLLSVHLDDGRSVSGRTSTDRLSPGERRVITAEWSIPAGSTPRAVEVIALVYPDGEASETPRETGEAGDSEGRSPSGNRTQSGDSDGRSPSGNRTQSGDGDGTVETIERRVELAKIPVRGG